MSDNGKPDWKDAPEYANWLAQDQDGSWWWYEKLPDPLKGSDGDGVWRFGGRCEKVGVEPNEGWRETLEQRPDSLR